MNHDPNPLDRRVPTPFSRGAALWSTVQVARRGLTQIPVRSGLMFYKIQFPISKSS